MPHSLSPQRQELLNNFNLYQGMDPELYRQSLCAIAPEVETIRARISEISMYPIKGMQGMYVQHALITEKGLATTDGLCRDRQAMLVRIDPTTGKRHRFSGKDSEHIGKLQVFYDEVNEEIEITAPGTYITPVYFSADELWPEDYDPVPISLGNDEIVRGVLVEDSRFETIEAMLHVYETMTGRTDPPGAIQLITAHTNSLRYSDTRASPNPAYQTQFSDGAQLHITNQATLDWLNTGLKKAHGNDYRTMLMEAFRPNIVLCDAPANIEDIVQAIRIRAEDTMTINLARLTPRCKVPQRDIRTGVVLDGEPLSWLRIHRPRREKGQPTFGVNAEAEPDSHGKILSAGDTVRFEGERRNY